MQNLVLSNSCKLERKGLVFSDSMPFDEWLSIGSKLNMMQGSVHFWIGDWLNFGEHRYGEMYAQAMDETRYSYQTLANDKWVSNRVPLSRRRENLSFEHHKEVADLEPEDQELLLKKAEDEKLPSSKFRKLVYQYTLRLNLPELTEEQIQKATNPNEDFKKVQEVINKGLDFLDALGELKLTNIADNARDYLLSHLRDVVKLSGGCILHYEKQTPGTVEVDPKK